MTTPRMRGVVIVLAVIFFGCGNAMKKILRKPIDFRFTRDLQNASPKNDDGEKHQDENTRMDKEAEHHESTGEKRDKLAGGGSYKHIPRRSEYLLHGRRPLGHSRTYEERKEFDRLPPKKHKENHEFDKGEKGYVDNEDHKKEYEESDGIKKKEHEEGSHYGEHHDGEKSEKEAEFKEEEKHQKGHSTKGQHNIIRKDEYEKKRDFYDEHHEGGAKEEVSGYRRESEGRKGNHFKKGHLKSDRHEGHQGKKKKHEKGHHRSKKKGGKSSEGHDKHHHHDIKYGKKGGKAGGKKWFFKSD